jgi:hypothetical protein
MRPRCNTQPASGQKGNRSPLQGTGSKVIHYPYLSARISGPTNPTAMDHTGNLDGPRGLRRSTHTTIICARPGEHQRRQTTDPTARTCERTKRSTSSGCLVGLRQATSCRNNASILACGGDRRWLGPHCRDKTAASVSGNQLPPAVSDAVAEKENPRSWGKIPSIRRLSRLLPVAGRDSVHRGLELGQSEGLVQIRQVVVFEVLPAPNLE